MRIDFSRLHKSVPPAFVPLFKCRDRYLVIWGGAGSGKSEFAARKVIWRACCGPQKYLCLRKQNVDVVKSVVPLVRSVLDAWKIPYTYRQQPYHTLALRTETESEIICSGLDDPEKLKSVPYITSTWMEEATELDFDDFLQVDLRLRGETEKYKQHMLTFNPVLRSNWTHAAFFEDQPGRQRVDDHTHKHRRGKLQVTTHHSTYVDNPFIDDEYREVLDNLASQSEQHHTVYKLGQWGAISGTVYYAFGREWNVDDAVTYDQHLPVLWSHDFNIGEGKPMSSCLCQLRREGDRQVLYVVDEIILDTGNTLDACHEFAERIPQDWTVHVYGDAAGKARDTRGNRTDYELISEFGYKQQDVPRKNPSIRDRHNVVNRALKDASGDIRVKIHPRCKTLIKGLETVKVKKGANYIEEETYEQHVTTALGYLICRVLPVTMRVASGRKYWN